MPVAGTVSGMVEVRRDALLERIARVQPKILAVIAPAGFGKSTLARQLIEGKGAATCDAAGLLDDLDLARRLLRALAPQRPQRTASLNQRELINAAVEAWDAPASDTIFVFENAEHICRDAGAREFLARLLAQRGERRAVVICSRENLRVHVTRFAAPHEILTLRADDLAFTRSELANVFETHAAQPGFLSRITQLSQGWPIAVFLLKRFANEGRLEMLLESLGHVAFEELHDYLADQVLALLDPSLVNALFACACIPRADDADLSAAVSDEAIGRDLAQFARESPFLSRTADGAFVLHPLLASVLVEHRQEERNELLVRTALAHERRGAYERAAELYMARGDPAGAAHALAQHEVMRDNTPSKPYARVLSSLDRSLVQRYPRLWAVTVLLRLFSVDTEELLDEAQALWRMLAPRSSALERYYIMLFRVLCMTHLGLLDDAMDAVEKFCLAQGINGKPRTYFDGYIFYLRGLVHARLGHLAQSEDDLTIALPLVASMDALAAETLRALGAEIARVRGEYALARQFLDRALEAARRSGLHNVVAHSLAEGAFGAWLSGDETLLGRYASELSDCVHRNGVRGFAYFCSAVHAGTQTPDDADLPSWVACGLLIEATTAVDPAAAVRRSRAALAAAQQCRQLFLECLCSVALAHFEYVGFDEHMRRAIAVAERCDGTELIASVRAVAERAANRGMLDAFVQRLERERIERVAMLEVQLTDGRVHSAGKVVALSERELALLVALALRREVVARSRLADILWPDLDDYSSRNALSVCLHRLRAHLGNDRAIVRSGDGYALHSDVRVDLWDIDRAVAALRARSALSESDRHLMMDMYERLSARRPDRMLQWDWFEATERHIIELRLEVAARLAREALSHGEPRRALELAQEMISHDPCDEAARHIAITAHVAIGDRGAALRQYRQYRDILAQELQAEPSAELKHLVGLS
jgi:DNA-binding SARP family transcriptional activator